MSKKLEKPQAVARETKSIKTDCGMLYVTLIFKKGYPDSVSIQLANIGGCTSSMLRALGRMISIALQAGVPVENIVKKLESIRCHAILSCSEAIAEVLEEYCRPKRKPAKKVKK